MRVTLLSDIHGNMVALDAVLADCRDQGYDQLICLGDVAYGEEPHASVASVQALGCPVVMGNTDDQILRSFIGSDIPNADDWKEAVARWCFSQLSTEDRAFVRTFVPTYTLELGNGQILVCYHGSPQSYSDKIFPTTPQRQLAEIFAGIPAAVAAGGHTHLQMVRRWQEMTILNVGSVGRPYNYDQPMGEKYQILPWAEYTMLTVERGRVSVDLRRVPVDRQAILERARGSGMPHIDRWLAGLR